MPHHSTLTVPILLFFYSCIAPAPAPITASEKEFPNILFILTDDQGIGDLSLHGNDSIRTPNLDELLLSGARFDRFYVDPVCAPTRASFLSGMYAPRTGATYVTRRRETIAAEITTLPEQLRATGYRTALFGKWHNGATLPYHPAGQGFDEFLGFTLGHFNDYFEGELRDEHDRPVPFQGDLTDLLTDSARHWMTDGGSAPFFAMIAYQAPHTPVQVADDHWDSVNARGLTPYNTGIYAMIESIDEQVGRLLDELESQGMLDNTIVVYATDNGPNGDRYRMGLRGTKGQIDEGSVRVPFVLRLPGEHPANGQLFSTPAAHIDLLPTLLDYLAIPVPDSLDGLSLMPLFEGRQLPARNIYTFHQAMDFQPYPGSMRDSSYIYVARSETQHELYDLRSDPGQQHDLFNRLPEIGQRMRSKYAALATSVLRAARVAPPIDLGAASGILRLLAHEGEPLGDNWYSQEGGWANDHFKDLKGRGARWPLVVPVDEMVRITVHYHLAGDANRTLTLRTDKGDRHQLSLSPARSQQLPVADRVQRKEAYPRRWPTAQTEAFTLSAGSKELVIETENTPGLLIKELTVEKQ